MITVYHGTNKEAAQSIIQNGFNSPESIWLCSDDFKTYVRKNNDESSLGIAIDSARIAAAHNNSKFTDVCVLKMQMNDDVFEDEFLPDVSCEYADDCYEIDSDRLNDLIENGKITMSLLTVSKAYNPYLRAYYLANLNEYYYAINDETLRSAIEIIRNSNCYYDDLFAFSDIKETEILAKYPA